jgi:hypothetical protein
MTDFELFDPATGKIYVAYTPSDAADAVQANLGAHTSDLANPHAVTKAQIGLSAVNNTSDADKPVSAAQAAADALVASNAAAALSAHAGDTSNPHATTAAQVGADAIGSAMAALAAAAALMEWQHVQTYTFPSDLTSYDFTTAIDSTVESAWMVKGEIISAGAVANNVSPRLNGAIVAMTRQTETDNANTKSADRNTGTFVASVGNANGDKADLRFEIYSTTRLIKFQSEPSRVGSQYREFRGSGEITTPAPETALTSIGIETNQANGLKAGTRVSLYKGRAL